MMSGWKIGKNYCYRGKKKRFDWRAYDELSIIMLKYFYSCLDERLKKKLRLKKIGNGSNDFINSICEAE